MILFHNGYIVLEYDATTDILQATCPDFKQEELLHIHAAFAEMIKFLKEKHIKYLLLDASSSLLEMKQEDYNTVLTMLATDLATTDLQKLARLITPDTEREDHLRQLLQESDTLQGLP